MRIKDNFWIQDIHTTIERCWLSINIDLHNYHLEGKSYNHKDVFDLITHHVLKDICDEIICGIQNGTKCVLYLNTKFDLRKSEYIKYGADTVRVVERLEKLISRIIPAYIIERPYPLYYDFITKYKEKEAEAVEEIEKIELKFSRNAFKPFNLNKVIKYLDKRGLKYLSSEYFQQANNKLLAANK